MWYILVFLFYLTQATSPVLNGDSVLITTLCDQQFPAFRLALRDIHQDWYGTFGRTTVKSEDRIPVPTTMKYYTSNSVVFIGSRKCLAETFTSNFPVLPQLQSEQHVCQVLAFNSTGLFYPLLCYGEDLLGTVYATYAFSHEILGIDPQAFWVEKKPVVVSSIPIPVNFKYDSGIPTWKNRGFFINDEDQLGGWAMDPIGQKVFTLQMWDMVYETILRLKGNMVVVGTSAYPDEQSFDLAVRRGLTLSQHHVTILGSAMFAWPTGLPYDFPFNPEVITENWKRNVMFEIEKERNVIWTVGYRGKNDYPFWNDVPVFNTSESRGKLISDAILAQLKIINNFAPTQQKVGYLWDELLQLYVDGYLTFPPEVIVVHADNGAGQVFHQELVDKGHGVYYHNAMMSDQHNQLTELLSPSRLFDQLQQFVKKLATAFFLLNTSDMRAVPLSTKACMDFAWNSQQFLNVSPIEAQDMFIKAWVSKIYMIPTDSALCLNITNIYDAYFNVPYMAGTTGITTVPLGEHHFATETRNLANDIVSWATSNKQKALPVNEAKQQISLVTTSLDDILAIIAAATPIKKQLPDQRQAFFNNHVLVQLQIHSNAVQSLLAISQAVLALESNSNPTAIQKLQQSIAFIDKLIAAEQTAEDGQWQNWYMWDQIVDWFSLRDSMVKALLCAQGETQNSNLPPTRPHIDGTVPTSQEFQYEYAVPTYYPLFYESKYWMDTAVTVMCSSTSSNCHLTAIGVSFSGTEAYVVLGAPNLQNSIHYTLDGTDPTIKSPLWNGQPIKILSSWAQGNATLNAASFDSTGIIAGPITKAICVTSSK